jgi:hypothetical protein
VVIADGTEEECSGPGRICPFELSHICRRCKYPLLKRRFDWVERLSNRRTLINVINLTAGTGRISSESWRRTRSWLANRYGDLTLVRYVGQLCGCQRPKKDSMCTSRRRFQPPMEMNCVGKRSKKGSEKNFKNRTMIVGGRLICSPTEERDWLWAEERVNIVTLCKRVSVRGVLQHKWWLITAARRR